MQQRNKDSAGFTLIELVIVVVVVGILAAIAYPAYIEQVRKSRRSDAYIALTQLANAQEKFYLNCNSYTPFIGAATAAVGNCVQANSALGYGKTTSSRDYYNLSITVADANGYTLQAAAAAAEVQAADTACATLTLTSTGLRTSADSYGVLTTRCW